MSLAILFYFLCAQHVSDINISIIRNFRLFCWITTLVVLFLVRCVLEFRCGWFGVVSVLQASACNTDTTPTQPHRNSNTHRTKNNTTNVVIQQNSRKLLMMGINSGAKRTHFFQIIVNFFIFNIKKYVNTTTTCNKCSFDYLHWLLNYEKLYRKDGVLVAVHTSGASPQSSASNLLTFLVAQLQFLREMETFRSSTVRGFRTETFDLRWPQRKKSQADLKNMGSFCATLY